MELAQLRNPPFGGLTTNLCRRNPMRKMLRCMVSNCSFGVQNLKLTGSRITLPKKKCYHLTNDLGKFLPSQIHSWRNHSLSLVKSQSNSACSTEEGFTQTNGRFLPNFWHKIFELIGSTTSGSRSVCAELMFLALPAIIGQVFEPFSQLMETAYVGKFGPVELASAGLSVSTFNVISKLLNIPLLSITTSFVAEDISKHFSKEAISDKVSQEETNDKIEERMKLPSVSTALVLASGIGIVEALALYLGSGLFLNIMGVSSASPMYILSKRFLSLRALGAPAVVLSLAIQGIFRGFKDTSTPLLCLGVGNLSSVFLLPIFIYFFQLGITGAAIATVASQYILTFMLLWFLNQRAVLLPPKMKDLQFAGYLKSGGLLIGRTLAVLMTMTLGTSMAARQGALAMAAHQVCFQVWLAVSLLSDALAVSGQALLASSFSEHDYRRVKEITFFVLKSCIFIGVALAVILSIWFGSFAQFFTKDAEVLRIVGSGMLFVCVTQPINSLAFVFDGLHYGVSDFSYAALSMMLVGAISSLFLLCAPSVFGLPGVWSGLTLFMFLRMLAGILRLTSKSGPWWFLQDLQESEVSERRQVDDGISMLN